MWPFKKRKEKDMVLLRLHNGSHYLREVEWFGDIPFAAPYLPDTRCQLKPNGELVGQSFVEAWVPASKKMGNFFHGKSMEEK